MDIPRIEIVDPVFSDPSPYPPLTAACPDARHAMMLAEGYAGPGGKLDAIALYLHSRLKHGAEEMGRLFEGIARVELEHLIRLGEAIEMLGGDARLGEGPGRAMWYGETLEERLHLMLASEYAAIARYDRYARTVGDAGVRALLRRLMLDERRHVALLRQALELT